MKAIQHALAPAGPQAAHIADLWWITVAASAIVFVAILAALAIALWRRPRATEATAGDPRPLHEHEPRPRRAVFVATAVSAAGLFGLLVASVMTDHALANLPLRDPLAIEIVAHQWWWDIHYSDPEPSKSFSTANEVHIPVGRPVLLTLKSADVIHSFWVPNLHGKRDLIPGRTATFPIQADKAGTYRGQCAEYCGAQHAYMGMFVVAEAPEAFERWRAAQAASAPEPTGAAAQGRDLFLSGSCMLCHAVRGTTADGRTGPDLTHVASRKTLAAGRLPNDAQTMTQWITDPQQFKPGTNMPAHALPAAQMQALVAYVESLK
jgi:cytochrome c oxidase subunit 2